MGRQSRRDFSVDQDEKEVGGGRTKRLGADKVTRAIVEEVILAGHDDLNARLARIGYGPRALADPTYARLPEIRRFLKGRPDTERTDELATMMRNAGLPI